MTATEHAARARRPTRLLLPTGRSDVRVSWHGDRDLFVVSLWRDGECVATAPLHPGPAADIAGFLVAHLGQRPRPPRPEPVRPAPHVARFVPMVRLVPAVRRLRATAGAGLHRLGDLVRPGH